MKQFYYSIVDKDAKEYGPMFPAKNDLIAIRHFKNSMKGVPEDVVDSFKLVCLFEFDTESGQLGLPFEQYDVQIEKKEAPCQGFDN